MLLLAIIFALLLPPLGVILGGGYAMDLIINILLCFLGFLPGVIHAFYVIIRENPGMMCARAVNVKKMRKDA